jgi:hypothetical protein
MKIVLISAGKCNKKPFKKRREQAFPFFKKQYFNGGRYIAFCTIVPLCAISRILIIMIRISGFVIVKLITE